MESTLAAPTLSLLTLVSGHSQWLPGGGWPVSVGAEFSRPGWSGPRRQNIRTREHTKITTLRNSHQ